MGRVRTDNANTLYMKKKYNASTIMVLAASDKGMYGKTRTMNRSTYADVMASMNKNFFDNRLNVNVQVGASLNDMLEESEHYEGGLATIPNFFAYGNISTTQMKRGESEWHDQVQSVFGSAEIGWDSQYYLTVTGRNDWASMLAFTDKMSYFYPSVGGSWLISETLRDILPQAISFLKVRGSWAEVASSPSRYLTRMQYVYNDQTNQYEWPSKHYNPNLKPENTKSYEIGLERKVPQQHNRTRVHILQRQHLQPDFQKSPRRVPSGYKTNLIQTGNIRNRGIEAALNYNNQWGDWRFTTGVTYSLNRNKGYLACQRRNRPRDRTSHRDAVLHRIRMPRYGWRPCRTSLRRRLNGRPLQQPPSAPVAQRICMERPQTGKVQLETVDYFKVRLTPAQVQHGLDRYTRLQGPRAQLGCDRPLRW